MTAMTHSTRFPLFDISTSFNHKDANHAGAACRSFEESRAHDSQYAGTPSFTQHGIKTPGSPIVSSSPSKYDGDSVFAFSSSPPRSSRLASGGVSSLPSSPPPLPSSPVALHPVPSSCSTGNIQIQATIACGETLHIGRKLKSVQDTIGVKKVTLPKAAKHASRRHCRVWLEDSSDGEMQVVVDVLGQNGMLLDGEKVTRGERRIALPEGKHIVNLGFYSGVEVAIEVTQAASMGGRLPLLEKKAYEDTHPTSEATLPLDLPSSPLLHRSRSLSLLAVDDEEGEKEEEAEPPRPTKRQRQNQSQSLRSSSVVAPSPYAHQDDDGFPPESSSEEEEENEADGEAKRLEHGELATRRSVRSLAEVAVIVRMEEATLRVKAAIMELNLDLVGCISSNLVFQPRATLTTSECVTLLLENQPSLRDVGDEQGWRPSVLHCLRTGPFGRIDHNGLKDASGKKLETSWHYSASTDGDAARRNSLAPFVKSVRQTQRQRKQYFYKRPSDLSKRRRW